MQSDGWFFFVYYMRISSANDFPSPYIIHRDWNSDQALVSSSQIAMPFPPRGVPASEEVMVPVLIKQIWDTSSFRKKAVVVLWWLLISPIGKKSTSIFVVSQWPQPGWLEMLSCCPFMSGAEQKGPSISDCRYFARGRNSLWGFKLPIFEAFLIIKCCGGNYNSANFLFFFQHESIKWNYSLNTVIWYLQINVRKDLEQNLRCIKVWKSLMRKLGKVMQKNKKLKVICFRD